MQLVLEMAEYVTSQRGKRKLCHEGHVYIKDRETDEEKVYWRCEQKRFCHGRVIVKGEEVQVTAEHNHAPDGTRKEVIKTK